MEVNARHVYQASVDKVFSLIWHRSGCYCQTRIFGARNVEFDYCYLKEALAGPKGTQRSARRSARDAEEIHGRVE